MSQNFFRLTNLFLLRHRLLLFLIALLLLLLLFPLIQEQFISYVVVMEIFFSILLIAGIYAVSTNRELLMIAILLAILTFSVIWFNIFLNDKGLLILGVTLQILFFSLTTVTILLHVLQYKRVTADKIYGAICGYLLLGVIWALFYTAIENVFPGSFQFNYDLQSIELFQFTHPFYFAHFMYYSFVTLTTLGYGDISPLSNYARVLSSIEAVVGQLYLAVLIARLVGLHISHSILEARNKSLKNESKE